jgi:hypothetical protein
MTAIDEDTHPGFTIMCNICGSSVYVDNSLGFSATSGSWGSVDLVCNNDACDNVTEIVST